MKRRGFVGLLGALGLVGPEKLNVPPATMYAKPENISAAAGAVVSDVDHGGWNCTSRAERTAYDLKYKAWELFAKNDLDRRARKKYAAALLGGRHPHTVGTRSWAPWFTANVDARKFQADEAKDKAYMNVGIAKWFGEGDDNNRPFI